MKRIAALTVLSALVLSACTTTTSTAPVAPTGTIAYGLTNDNRLATFGTDNAQASLTTRTITGLAGNESLVDIDVRNTDNRLYGVTATGVVYFINVETGAAELDKSNVGKATQAVDFNPVANRLRVVGTANDNYRLTVNSAPIPNGGTAGARTDDGTFSYAVAQAASGTPSLVAAAYTQSYNDASLATIPTTPATDLYSLDTNTDSLVKHSTVSPAAAGTFGTVTAVAPLGLNVPVGLTGFDIAGVDTAFATIGSGNSTTLYTVNLGATGTTDALTVKSTISGISIKALALKLPNRPS